MSETLHLKNPFVGLRSFEENEDYLFFGRGIEIDDLLKKFGGSRLLAVVGSSGCGKSSLVKSGLLPAIFSGFLSVGKNWRVALLRPGNDPIGNLTKELSREGVLHHNTASLKTPMSPIVESTLRRSTNGLLQAYEQAHLPSAENLLIVVDQFEELFRYSKYEKQLHEGRSDAQHFVNLLLAATHQTNSPVYVLITMRSDFIGDCAEFRGLPEAINKGQYLVPRMTRDEIREAITGPIAVGGAKITPRLLTRLLNDVGNNLDQLPILQHAMMRTWEIWEKKKQPNRPIDLEDYEQTGMMASALSKHAEEIYAELTTAKQRLICELMFKALTDKAADVRGIRRPTSVADLCELTNAQASEVISIVELFRKEGRTFLMPPPTIPLDKKSIIDISHESLMRVWQRLIKWADDEAKSASIYLDLSKDALRYENKEIGLWNGPQLARGLNWYKTVHLNAKWAGRYNSHFEKALAFLNESERAERSKKNWRRALYTSIVTLILLIAVVSSISFVIVRKERNIAQDKEREANDSAKAAREQRRIAEDSTASARLQRQRAEDSTTAAQEQRQIAVVEAARARREELRAIEANDSLKQANNNILNQNKKIAAAEYQKQIRIGPIDEDLIKADTFNYKLIAYDYHLKKLGEKEDNDVLYEKLYYCIKMGPDQDTLLRTTKIKTSDTILLKDHMIYPSSNKLQLLMASKNGKGETPYTFNQKISAIAADTFDKRIFVATESNLLTIWKYDEKYSLTMENKIPMGGLVTAIDYFAGRDLIFFGLKTGEIGYINYADKKKSKYQPVYRNQLDSKITGVTFFSNSAMYYLLATSQKGKAVVYEMGSTKNSISEFLNVNTKLTEIALPEYLGDIRRSGYDARGKRAVLVTSKNTYLWNPFVNELLAQLEQSLDDSLLQKQITYTKYYQDK